MALFLQILEGENPATATPVIATRDRRIIASVAMALQDRLLDPLKRIQETDKSDSADDKKHAKRSQIG